MESNKKCTAGETTEEEQQQVDVRGLQSEAIGAQGLCSGSDG